MTGTRILSPTIFVCVNLIPATVTTDTNRIRKKSIWCPQSWKKLCIFWGTIFSTTDCTCVPSFTITCFINKPIIRIIKAISHSPNITNSGFSNKLGSSILYLRNSSRVISVTGGNTAILHNKYMRMTNSGMAKSQTIIIIIEVCPRVSNIEHTKAKRSNMNTRPIIVVSLTYILSSPVIGLTWRRLHTLKCHTAPLFVVSVLGAGKTIWWSSVSAALNAVRVLLMR